MDFDEPEYEIKEWIRIVTYTLFIWIFGYIFHDYYIMSGMEAGLWIYIFWVFFLIVYYGFKNKKGVR